MEELARFLVVADLKSVSRAAHQLHISQPALSRTIGQLEDRYRTVLFQRGHAGMSLTDAGHILYDHASRALRSLRDAEERIQYEASGGNLSLAICAGNSWGNSVLPTIIREFIRDRPDIRVRLDIIGSEARMAGLASGNYDLSFGIALPQHERLGQISFEPMLHAPYAVYGASDHPLHARNGLLRESELVRFSWIRHKFEFDHDPAQWHVTGRDYAVSTNTMVSTLELVRQSDLLISTSEMSASLFASHDVHRLGPDPLSADHVSGLHTMRSVEPSHHARLFASYCRQRCPELFPENAIQRDTERLKVTKGATPDGTRR